MESSVQKSVLNWASLFKVNHDGFLAIEEWYSQYRDLYIYKYFNTVLWKTSKNAKNTIDNVVRNLGNLDESGKVRSRQETERHMRLLLNDAKQLLEVYPSEELAITSG